MEDNKLIIYKNSDGVIIVDAIYKDETLWLSQKGMSKVLEYKDWRNFLKVLNKAKEACKNSGFNIDEQLVEHNKLSKRNN